MSSRGLVVLADGAQAAFCAGVVAQLTASGRRWGEAAAAGLAAQVALLALAGEAEEAARRFLRLAQEGAALFRPALAYAREGLNEGFLLLPDPFRLSGWLSPAALGEYLAPETALAGRVKLWLCTEDLASGQRGWRELTHGGRLSEAAAFPWGFPPVAGLWGGVGACAELDFPPLSSPEVDVVCGFPWPAVERPGLGNALLATVQRREEIAAALTVTRWAGQRSGLQVFAPTQEQYAAFAKRDGALLGVEYPLPVEHNAELVSLMVEFGRFVGAQQGG